MKVIRCFMCEKKTSSFRAAAEPYPVDLCLRCFGRVFGLAERTAEHFRALLKLTEWEGGMDDTCPVCKAYVNNGHAETCELGNVLHSPSVEEEEIKSE